MNMTMHDYAGCERAPCVRCRSLDADNLVFGAHHAPGGYLDNRYGSEHDRKQVISAAGSSLDAVRVFRSQFNAPGLNMLEPTGVKPTEKTLTAALGGQTLGVVAVRGGQRNDGT